MENQFESRASNRRYDLDWIRVIVFGLLILYHVGMFFVPWSWHIKNETLAEWLVWPMSFLSKWRLPILFLISGMGTRLALSQRSWREFLGERTVRLLIPLVFGIFVIVPPQVYVERQVSGSNFSSYWDFYPHFFEGIYPSGNFSWHHLWFLPYLLVYSFALSPILIYCRNKPDSQFFRIARRWLNDGRIWIVMAVPLVLVEYGLQPYFPSSHNLVWDWYNFAHYLLMFLYGFVLISMQETLWGSLERSFGWAVTAGVIAFVLIAVTYTVPEIAFGQRLVGPLLEVVNLGAWCIAFLAFGARYLNRPSTALSYCNEAVYPCYIAHQTILVVVAYWIYEKPWSVVFKFGLLALVTLAGSLLTFEIVRRIPIVSICFGIKKTVRSQRVAA